MSKCQYKFTLCNKPALEGTITTHTRSRTHASKERERERERESTEKQNNP